MVINKELLEARKKIADRRPEFVRQESWRYNRPLRTGENLKAKITR